MINETARVQRYIDVHKNLILHDALKDMENCEINELAKLLHRLKGTLGTFQFQDLSNDLRIILLSVKQDKSSNNLIKAKNDAITAILNELQSEKEEKGI